MPLRSAPVFEQKPLNLHIYPTAFRHETRILKVTGSMIRHQIAETVVVLAVRRENLPEWEAIDRQRFVWRIPVKHIPLLPGKIARIVRYFIWFGKIVSWSLRRRIQMVNCHSVMDLPAGVLLKIIHRCRLVYEPHELETERNGFKGGLQLMARISERVLIPCADLIFVVSPSIRNWYRARYGLERVTVIRNVPQRKNRPLPEKKDYFRRLYGIAEDEFIFLYQGLLYPGRAIRLLLDVFSRLPADRHVVFMGYGILADAIQSSSRRNRNIHFHGSVPPDEVLRLTAQADVGLSLIENICLSYYFSLPNKVFEYLLAGLPCIVSDFPDMSALIDQTGAGWKVAVAHDPLKQLLGGIGREDISERSRHAREAECCFGWHLEEQKLVAAYRRLAARTNT